MITISVPAKVHLLGEHSVVYGKPALLSAINLRVLVTISSEIKQRKNATEDPYDENAFALQKIIETVIKKKFKIKTIPPYRIKVTSEIPIGYGLGSSAAISAGYSAALLSFLKIEWDYTLVNEIAYEGEKLFHGNPSGGDVAAVINGGFIWFRKELESLKIIHPIPHKIHKSIGQFFLIDSGKPVENTKEMVRLVKQKLAAESSKLKAIFDDQEKLTKELLVSLLDGNQADLINTIKKGEKNLETLGVVGSKVKSMIRDVESIGGACKILGGGGVTDGSGMLLAYHQNSKELLELIKHNKWNFKRIKLGETGLKKEFLKV